MQDYHQSHGHTFLSMHATSLAVCGEIHWAWTAVSYISRDIMCIDKCQDLTDHSTYMEDIQLTDKSICHLKVVLMSCECHEYIREESTKQATDKGTIQASQHLMGS